MRAHRQPSGSQGLHLPVPQLGRQSAHVPIPRADVKDGEIWTKEKRVDPAFSKTEKKVTKKLQLKSDLRLDSFSDTRHLPKKCICILKERSKKKN